MTGMGWMWLWGLVGLAALWALAALATRWVVGSRGHADTFGETDASESRRFDDEITAEEYRDICRRPDAPPADPVREGPL